MFKRALSMLMVLLFWSVQTAEAVVHDHVEPASISIFQASGDDAHAELQVHVDPATDEDGGPFAPCDMNCSCHVLHHIYVAPAEDAEPKFLPGSGFSFFDASAWSLRTPPPTRPPLA